MKAIYLLPFLFLAAFSSSASAGWKCSGSTATSYANDCATAGVQKTPEALVSAFVSSVISSNTNVNRKDYKAGACTLIGSTNANCAFSYTSFGNVINNSIGTVKEAAVCPPTVEARGPNASTSKTGDKYFVIWSVRTVTSDICHNSCSYLASSAKGGTCYLAPGLTDTGFCNFSVDLNSASPSCGAEAGYTAPSVGDPLTPSIDPGDGGGDGSNPGGGDDGGDGNGGNGGDGDSGFDGELSFSNPGSLNADAVIDNGVNSVHYGVFVRGMEVDLNESGFGQAMTEFKENIAAAGSGGQCPTADVAILGTIVSFDAHCVLFAEISPLLSAVFLAAWSLIALRVFLSA
ncbi:hypothetical protein [Pseudomonas yamanorum]|uniref:hypothetical protein n=1 Tax=Pseudomonas yamanorum TaxID=515393 RepID=UPI0012FDDC55|nr:hypothetical protein [Pseudomonas yamanorum]